MNPRAQAQAKVGDAYDARVLEPSPPAAAEPPWFADDPVARDGATRPVVSPVSSGDVPWSALAAEDPSLAAWCRERWLGPYPPLAPLPASFETTRLALHAVAEQVVSPARERANGKIGLRFVRGGFGTPFFGDGAQVAVVGTSLRVVRGGDCETRPLTSLAAAATALGDLADPDRSDLADAPLAIDETAARVLGDWYGFCWSVLEELRARAGGALDPSRVQLWPEHFDAAVEIGGAGTRAYYGGSPGDANHPEPYVYVQPYEPPPAGGLWQATGFAGAELAYAELLAAADPRALALDFLAVRLAALT